MTEEEFNKLLKFTRQPMGEAAYAGGGRTMGTHLLSRDEWHYHLSFDGAVFFDETMNDDVFSIDGKYRLDGIWRALKRKHIVDYPTAVCDGCCHTRYSTEYKAEYADGLYLLLCWECRHYFRFRQIGALKKGFKLLKVSKP